MSSVEGGALSNGEISLDASAAASVGYVQISTDDADASDLSSYLGGVAVGDYVRIGAVGDSEKWVFGKVNYVDSGSGYVGIGFSVYGGIGTFAESDDVFVLLDFAPTLSAIGLRAELIGTASDVPNGPEFSTNNSNLSFVSSISLGTQSDDGGNFTTFLQAVSVGSRITVRTGLNRDTYFIGAVTSVTDNGDYFVFGVTRLVAIGALTVGAFYSIEFDASTEAGGGGGGGCETLTILGL